MTDDTSMEQRHTTLSTSWTINAYVARKHSNRVLKKPETIDHNIAG